MSEIDPRLLTVGQVMDAARKGQCGVLVSELLRIRHRLTRLVGTIEGLAAGHSDVQLSAAWARDLIEEQDPPTNESAREADNLAGARNMNDDKVT